ncbi:DNA cytosine methyltransferase [Rhizobium leguminosarum]|uniref:DNA cytosine methyltransferase n=1 Tax=Rhizobium leguminosarum TaxID=384 RepID=UPI002E10C3B4|nr:DNA cytosine methyltransferase [Rhizobium leguminosarum]
MRTIRIGEYFCGAGGMAAGALSAGGALETVQSVWAVDADQDACATYAANLHSGEPVLSELPAEGYGRFVLNADVRTIDPTRLPDVDGFLFGFPCNDFSTAGESRGLSGRHGPLYREGVRVLKAKRPAFFVAENVGGILQTDDCEAFSTIVADLSRPGDDLEYDVTPHLYRLEEFGLPQRRHRVMIVGVRSDVAGRIGGFLPPRPCGRLVSAGDALAGMDDDLPNHEAVRTSGQVLDRLGHIEPGRNVWDVNEHLPRHLRMKNSATRMSTMYKVLDPTRPAYTVVASSGGGMGMYHWNRRPTTNRERARLQSFPDDFVFLGGASSVRRQIGMAVPPLAARTVVGAVLDHLAGRPYDAVAPNLRDHVDPDFKARRLEARAKAARRREAAKSRSPVDHVESLQAS